MVRLKGFSKIISNEMLKGHFKGTINLIALCLCILPVMGYFGAKRYDKNYLIGYIIYNVISIS